MALAGRFGADLSLGAQAVAGAHCAMAGGTALAEACIESRTSDTGRPWGSATPRAAVADQRTARARHFFYVSVAERGGGPESLDALVFVVFLVFFLQRPGEDGKRRG